MPKSTRELNEIQIKIYFKTGFDSLSCLQNSRGLESFLILIKFILKIFIMIVLYIFNNFNSQCLFTISFISQ